MSVTRCHRSHQMCPNVVFLVQLNATITDIKALVNCICHIGVFPLLPIQEMTNDNKNNDNNNFRYSWIWYIVGCYCTIRNRGLLFEWACEPWAVPCISLSGSHVWLSMSPASSEPWASYFAVGISCLAVLVPGRFCERFKTEVDLMITVEFYKWLKSEKLDSESISSTETEFWHDLEWASQKPI